MSASLWNGLLAYYQFDNNLNDRSGNNYHMSGPFVGYYSPGRVGSHCVNSTSNSDVSASIPYFSTISHLSGDFSLAVWFNIGPTSTTGGRLHARILTASVPNGPTTDSFRIFQNTPTTNNSVIEFGVPGNVITYNLPVISTNVNWYHFVLTRQGNLCSAYVNGALYTSNNFTFPTFYGLSTVQSRVYASLNWNMFDEMALWSRALTASEVTSLYNLGNNSQDLFSVLNRQTSDRTVVFHVLRTISSPPSRDIVYHVRSSAERSNTIVFDVSEQIATQKNAVYHVYESALTSQQIVYDVFQSTQSSRTIVYNLDELVSLQNTIVFDNHAMVAADQTVLYDVRRSESTQQSVVFDVFSLAQKQTDILFDVLSLIHTQRDILFDVWDTLPLYLQKDVNFDIFSLVNNQADVIFDVFSQIQDERTLLFDVGGRLTVDYSIVFDLAARQARNYPIVFDIYSILYRSRMLLFDVRETLFSQRSLLFDVDHSVIPKVYSDNTIVFTIYRPAVVERTLSYRVDGQSLRAIPGVFSRVWGVGRVTGGTQIFWEIDRRFYDPYPWQFRLERSDVYSPDDWTPVTDWLIDPPYLVDVAGTLDYGGARTVRYRVALLTPIAQYVSPAIEPAALDRRPEYHWAREIIRLEHLNLRRTGKCGALLKLRRMAPPCPQCNRLGGASDSHCPNCYGTGHEGGYHTPIGPVCVLPMLATLKEQPRPAQDGQAGTTLPVVIPARAVVPPHWACHDVFVEKGSDRRYEISAIKQEAMLRDQLLVVTLEMFLLPPDHIVYRFPIDYNNLASV